MAVEPDNELDVRLLQRIVARDATAVAELYDRHSRPLFGVILRILRTRDEAEDVLQEVFMRVWTRGDTYDERLGCPAAWLTRMARNRAIDRLRARRTRDDAQHATEPEVATDRGPAPATPEDQAAETQRHEHVQSALASLPAEQRDLIAAAFFEGYTHSELAARFNLPLGTVKTRIRNGMLAMRAHLEHVV
jgi:RNA polymerase sigma-70 factor (ECF subfamily)